LLESTSTVSGAVADNGRWDDKNAAVRDAERIVHPARAAGASAGYGGSAEAGACAAPKALQGNIIRRQFIDGIGVR